MSSSSSYGILNKTRNEIRIKSLHCLLWLLLHDCINNGISWEWECGESETNHGFRISALPLPRAMIYWWLKAFFVFCRIKLSALQRMLMIIPPYPYLLIIASQPSSNFISQTCIALPSQPRPTTPYLKDSRCFSPARRESSLRTT
jgi:hypothetical protein